MADLGATPARGGPGAEESSSAPRFSSADLVAGALFVALGLAFALGSLQYERGTLLKMGPGYVPLTLGVVLALMGAGIVAKAFLAPDRTVEVDEAGHDPMDSQAVDHGHAAGEDAPRTSAAAPAEQVAVPLAFGAVRWRPVVLVLAAILFFAFTFEGLGLLLSAFGTVLLASFARQETTVRQALLTSVVLTVACWLIFVLALQQRLPLVGDWLGG